MKRKTDVFDEDKRPSGDITMERFENSLNFIVGVVNSDPNFDILNNPYIEYKAHQIHNGPNGESGITVTNSHELIICPAEQKSRFILEKNFGWYP